MSTRLVLFGTPEFAERSFASLLESKRYDLPLIVTQPDKPSGRGMELTPSPVKRLALKHNVEVLQPESLKGITGIGQLESSNPKNQELCARLNALAPIDLFIVVAYGKIIPKSLLEFPRLGALNIRGSLLPRWRGAAPIHRAVAAGDTKTGVCLMSLEEGLDTGPVYSFSEAEISSEDNLGTVHDRLAELGRILVINDLPKILSGELTANPQSGEGITYADKWEKQDLEICWTDSPETTINRIRASAPVPGARTTLKGDLVKIYRARIEDVSPEVGIKPPGSVVALDSGYISVALPSGKMLLIDELQLAGRKRLPATEVIRGRGIQVGEVLGT